MSRGRKPCFQRKALYSLRVFFPELTEADFQTLYAQLSQDAQYAETWEPPCPPGCFTKTAWPATCSSKSESMTSSTSGRRTRPCWTSGRPPGWKSSRASTTDGSAAGEKGDHTT